MATKIRRRPRGSKVLQQEEKEMWEYYQECGVIAEVARKFRRDRGTVSRHIMAYESSVRTANILKQTLAAK